MENIKKIEKDGLNFVVTTQKEYLMDEARLIFLWKAAKKREEIIKHEKEGLLKIAKQAEIVLE